MTMLDRMRRRKNWLKWSLGIVVATFIALYFPSFMGPATDGTAPNDAIATVDGRPVTVAKYQRAYRQQVDQEGGAQQHTQQEWRRRNRHRAECV